MAHEIEPEDCNRKRVKQLPSIPFLWELRPGMPNKDWKPNPSPPITQIPPDSINLIASIPFVWEEKSRTLMSTSQANLVDPHLLLLSPPLLDVHGNDTSGSDDESFGFGTNKPYSIPGIPSHPDKFVASIPFEWEEEPGKPLPHFLPQAKNTVDSLVPLPSPIPAWNNYEEVSSTGSISFAEGGADNEQDEAYKCDVQSFIVSQTPTPRVPSLPVNLVASVPFMWEEKPGKPLSSFPLPPSNKYCPKFDLSDDLGDPGEHRKRMSEWETEPFNFEADEDSGLFGSELTLLANCIMPSSAISSAVPVEETGDSMYNSLKLASPSSSSSTSLTAFDAESSTSSYATGASGMEGPAFLEWLFPLFPPKLALLEKSGSHKRVTASTAEENRDFNCESNRSLVSRWPTTLWELIIMSRRKSYKRKPASMRKQNSSIREPMKKSAFGCGISGGKLIEALKIKCQLRLKPV